MTSLIDRLAKCQTCNNVVFMTDKICPYCKTPMDAMNEAHKEALK